MRTLVTSANHELWPQDEPIVFIGEWCKRYSQKQIWDKLDSSTPKYHWNDRNQLAVDYKYLDSIYEETLANLAEKLNSVHKTNYSKRFWRILIGPWLGIFIQIIFDRWKMITSSINSFEINKCNIYIEDLNKLVPNDMEEFISFFLSDSWNEMIYSKILKITQDKIILNEFENNQIINDPINKNKKQIIKFYLKNSLSYFLNIFGGKDDVFIYSSGFPKLLEAKLSFRLGQFPRFWSTRNIPKFPLTTSLRSWQINSLSSNCEFKALLNELIPKIMPKAYLEGFEQLSSNLERSSWPKNPKVIFTSTAYYSDDLFKIWTAKKVESGSELIIGQHGGNFGMTPRAFLEEHQIKICDYFLSWGWTNKKEDKVIPVGNLKTTKNKRGYDPHGGALMAEYALPRYSYQLYSVPISSQWLDYFNDQLKFIDCLPKNIRNKINVRLKGDFGWDQLYRWDEFDSSISVDIGEVPIKEVACKCRLFIATYNATTYLESMTWNIPTVIFWNPNHWELNQSTQLSFDLLESVGIFHRTPETAAEHICKIWDNVDSWWLDSKLQKVRSDFCDEFSLVSPSSELKIVDILKNK